jgi:hypothetical protein
MFIPHILNIIHFGSTVLSITGVEIIIPAMKKVIKEEKDQGFKRKNYYYNRKKKFI